jgi:hypothetical protein
MSDLQGNHARPPILATASRVILQCNESKRCYGFAGSFDDEKEM